jgi:hypothetical protein
MGRDHTLRLVENGDQLLDVVTESLRRLEPELQGETPAAPDLWNQLNDGAWQPKDERRLSDYLVRYLRRDLKQRGIIANREVEIRRGEGEAQGERTDIHVDAAVQDAGPKQLKTISVVAEVKGCWNKGLKKDMQEQLRDRYLKESQCCQGMYVVGWFACLQWDDRDDRKRRTPKMKLEEAQNVFDKQAAELSGGEVRIRAVVLNTGLR